MPCIECLLHALAVAVDDTVSILVWTILTEICIIACNLHMVGSGDPGY